MLNSTETSNQDQCTSLDQKTVEYSNEPCCNIQNPILDFQIIRNGGHIDMKQCQSYTSKPSRNVEEYIQNRYLSILKSYNIKSRSCVQKQSQTALMNSAKVWCLIVK